MDLSVFQKLLKCNVQPEFRTTDLEESIYIP